MGSRKLFQSVNGIKFIQIYKSKITLSYKMKVDYHSVSGISYGLAQSDPIKQRPL